MTHIPDYENYEQYEYEDTGQYPNQPLEFRGGTDVDKALMLFNAAKILNTGLFPERVNDLCADLAALFADIPCEDGCTKKLGSITYHKCGMALNSENGRLIMPPFEVSRTGDDLEDRIRILKSLMPGTYYMRGHFHESQILYAVSGKRPTAQKGAVARTLMKITKIVAKIEKQLEADPDTDRDFVFADLYGKLAELSTRNYYSYHDCYFNAYSQNPAIPDEYDNTLNGIYYMDGTTIKEVTDVLLSRALDRTRARKIIGSADDKLKTAYFVPMSTICGDAMDVSTYNTKDFREQLEELTKDVLSGSSCGRKQSSYYGEALIKSKMLAAVQIYNDIEAYAMYDSITDRQAREFFVKRGCLVEGWKPDPDLWLRAAKLLPPTAGKENPATDYADRHGINEDTRQKASALANEQVNARLDKIYEKLGSERSQEAKRSILDYAGPPSSPW